MARRLQLLTMWVIILLLHIQNVKTEVRKPCAMIEDWFPSDVEPQSSKPPYVLDVIRQRDGKSVLEDLYQNKPRYDWHENYTIFLNGTHSDNATEMFTGFMIYIYNEFEDEESGHFVKPLPAGVSMEECHFNQTSQWIEYVENSTSSDQWDSIQVKWESPQKYPAGKITISASVIKEQGVYWKGITLTLNHVCATPGCSIPNGCPDGLARNKYGCEICECAGAGSITVGFASLLVIAYTLLYNLI